MLAALFLIAYPIADGVPWPALLIDNVSDISLVVFGVGVLRLAAFLLKIMRVARQRSRAQPSGPTPETSHGMEAAR